VPIMISDHHRDPRANEVLSCRLLPHFLNQKFSVWGFKFFSVYRLKAAIRPKLRMACISKISNTASRSAACTFLISCGYFNHAAATVLR